MRRAVLIAGPTASGKSALALALAERVGGMVVNADSMQVYAGLRILTARPGREEERRAPHRLYGHVPARTAYSTGRWLGDLAEALAEADERGLVPIVTGGTGLYFSALTRGISSIPDVAEGVRAHWRQVAAEIGSAALHGRLAERDPVMAARLRPSDPQRVIRAMEVLDATGRSLAEWQAEAGLPLLPGALRFVLDAPRDLLRARIDARAVSMLEEGALDEVRALVGERLDRALPAMRALGVAGLARHLAGDVSRDEALAGLQVATRRYAKRQETWFRNQFGDWPRLPAGDPDEALSTLLISSGNSA